MVLTLLIDLDDTLLGNSMDVFIPAYLNALGNHLSDVIQPEILVTSMLCATRAMFSNRKLDQTLKQVFDSDFYPAIGIPEESLHLRINQFYTTEFTHLRKHTQFRPEARRLIETALKNRYQVIVATNPVFPRTAILQRLDWAGINHEKFHFPLIPSYESFHFAKPDPAFFTELLTRIGWPSGPVLMVGNDPEHDIYGSHQVGIPSFWIMNEVEKYPEDMPEPKGQGTLEEVVPWINLVDIEGLIPNFKTPSAMTAILRGVPAGIASLISPFYGNPRLNESKEIRNKLTEVISKMANLETNENLPGLEKILNGNKSPVPTIDQTGRKKDSKSSNQDSLSTFSQYLHFRIETLRLLTSNKDQIGLVESNVLSSAPTPLFEFLASMINREIELSRQVFKITNLLFPTEKVAQPIQ